MAKLIFSAITSLDGYIEDEAGNFDWAAPDEEVHRFINDLERPIGTYLYGRRMYETMRYWEAAEAATGPVSADFAEVWRAADKIVYSRSLESPSTGRTRVERSFDADAVRALKAAAKRDITVGGPELAAQAMRSGLVDECQLFLNPVLVGGGKPALPRSLRVDLELIAERRFGNGVVFVHYQVK